MPRFEDTRCSNCNRSFGPGDHGFSHCDQHPGYERDRKLARQAGARKGWETRRSIAAQQAAPAVPAQAAE